MEALVGHVPVGSKKGQAIEEHLDRIGRRLPIATFQSKPLAQSAPFWQARVAYRRGRNVFGKASRPALTRQSQLQPAQQNSFMREHGHSVWGPQRLQPGLKRQQVLSTSSSGAKSNICLTRDLKIQEVRARFEVETTQLQKLQTIMTMLILSLLRFLGNQRRQKASPESGTVHDEFGVSLRAKHRVLSNLKSSQAGSHQEDPQAYVSPHRRSLRPPTMPLPGPVLLVAVRPRSR